MPPTPQPDGGWDPSQSGGSSTTTAATTLWDLGGLDKSKPITIGYGSKTEAKRVAGSSLDPYDRETAQSTATSPSLGLPADLVKQPITLYSTDAKAYLAFQQALYAGGFYGSMSTQSIPWGSDPTGATFDAWKRVLIAAQQAQSAGLSITPQQVLERGIQQRKDAGTGAVPKAPLVIQTTDPATLTGLVQRAAQDALGRNLSKEEVGKFIASFHSQEQAFSRKKYAAEQDTTGKTFEFTSPDPTAQATEFVEGGHPTEAGGNKLADYVGVLQQLIGG